MKRFLEQLVNILLNTDKFYNRYKRKSNERKRLGSGLSKRGSRMAHDQNVILQF